MKGKREELRIPLKFEEAVTDFLNVGPPKEEAQKRCKEESPQGADWPTLSCTQSDFAGKPANRS